MHRTRVGFISFWLLIIILLTAAFTNTIPPLAIALTEGRTHDQAHDTGYIDWSGSVQYVYMEHRDYSELPPEEGGAFCGSGCWEWVTRIKNGGIVSGSFDRDVAYFEVMVASSHDSSVGNATLKACSAAKTRDMYDGPGAGMPGFVSLILSVPAGCRSWSLSASSGYINFRSTDVIYGAPPPVPTSTWTPLPSFTPTPTDTATLTATATNTPTSTVIPTITQTDTPSPTTTPLPPEVVGQIACDFWGTAGWCRGNETLELIASDPQGFDVTINGDLNGALFSCGASCAVPLPEGIGTASYLATSFSGRTANGSSSWQRDSTPPIIDATLPVLDGKNGWYVSDIDVSASASDETSGLSVLSGSVDRGATWNSLPLHLPEGVYSVTLYARDIAGNEVVRNESVRIDTNPPVLQVTSHVDRQRVHGHVTLGGTLEDGMSGIAKAELSFDGVTWRPVIIALDNTWSFSWNAGEASNGQYRLQVRGMDQAGNLGDTTSITLMVDNPLPQVSSVKGTEVVTIPFVVTIMVTATPSPTIASTATPENTSTAIPDTATVVHALSISTPQASLHPDQPAPSLPWWQVLGLIGLFLVIASASVVDPRPAALDRLRESINQITTLRKEDQK